MAEKKQKNETYKKIRLLGEGSFGKAVLVECQSNKELVQKYFTIILICYQCVIKMINLQGQTEAEKQDTLKEVKILEQLDHPNIIKFREVFKTKKQMLCIVMDYADGGDFSQKLKKSKNYFSESQILDWFTQLCLALKHCHDRKILHRDLKMQNLFITKDNILKLGDFGIAKVLSSTRDKTKTIVGTPFYLAPDIIENQPYSFMADIWSAGIILYELCALIPPFNADSLQFLALKIVRGQYSSIPNHYSQEMKQLINNLLQVNPDKRLNIHQILSNNFQQHNCIKDQPIVMNRIQNFLSETMRKEEFSHTIIHNQQFVQLQNKKTNSTKDKMQNNRNEECKSINNKNSLNQRQEIKRDLLSTQNKAVKNQKPTLENLQKQVLNDKLQEKKVSDIFDQKPVKVKKSSNQGSENSKNLEQMVIKKQNDNELMMVIQELQNVVGTIIIILNVNQLVENIPEQQKLKEHKYSSSTEAEEDREVDYEEAESPLSQQQQELKSSNFTTNNQEESIYYLQSNNLMDVYFQFNNFNQQLKTMLIENLGEKKFQKAYSIIKDMVCIILIKLFICISQQYLVQKEKNTLEIIEESDNQKYSSLLPFLAKDQIKKYLPLLLTYAMKTSH